LGNNLDYTGMSIDDSHKLLSDPGGRDITCGDNDGLKCSNGVLLKVPDALPRGGGDGGSLYYGTAFAPNTSIPTENYQNLLTISIDSTKDQISEVTGKIVHGLNTTDTIAYLVSYFTGIDEMLAGTQTFANFTNENVGDVIDFNSADTMLASALITKVTIVSGLVTDNQFVVPIVDWEWDFLLAQVSFEGSPVPLPAALPLFMSALLGGFVAARRKKPSDHKVSS
jgi:hypothetical protein